MSMKCALVILLLIVLPGGAHTVRALDIVTPSPNSVVQPGAMITVKVAPSGGEQLGQVAFATSDGVTTAAPGVFEAAVRVPIDAVGPEVMIAQATLVGGGFDVEVLQLTADPGPLVELSVSSPSGLSVIGQIFALQVTGLFKDGVTRDLTHPDRGTTYQSSNDSVLGVDPTGLIQARSHGTAQLLVSSRGLAKTATVHVDVPSPPPNQIPVPNAGPDRTVTSESLVELTAAASSDPDGDPLQYHWEQVSGRVVILRETETVAPNFVAPRVTSSESVLVFSLVVKDNKGATSFADTVQIKVTP